ncbi:MAG: Stk1 family PASTA domain-containing Ser/Thr kinase [Nocardioidaceae bacterium]
MTHTSSEALRGRLLDGRYLIGDRVARGGMATVYAATDTRLERLVAVKVMHTGLGDDEDFAARFVREARSAAKLNHPNVVAVFDQGNDDGTVFLVMEYVAGITLRDVIRDESPLPPRRALGMLEQVLTALSAAHDAGLVHRDIKPENVLIAPDGQVKVADFGLARAVSTSTAVSSTGALIGTVSYLPPELVTNEGADARSDVYASGIVLYEMLTGRKPFEAETPIQVAYKHVHQDVPAPSLVVSGIPDYLDALVARATARQRDLRPTDAKVLLRQVRRVRSALDQGVASDPDLTEDLTPLLPLGASDPTQALNLLPGVASPGIHGVAAWGHADTLGFDVPGLLLPPQAPYRESTLVVPRDPPTAPTPPGQQRNDQEPPRRRRRPRRGLILLLVVLLLAALAGFGGWYLGVGRFTNTPHLIGMTQLEAARAAKSAGLTMTVDRTSWSETAPVGTVMASDPTPDAQIVRGGTVHVVVSKGKERYTVPRLVGLSLAAARRTLHRLTLVADPVSRRYDETVRRGDVVSQSINAAMIVRHGAAIGLVVSKGPRPIKIADYTDKPAAEAISALRGLGFKAVVVGHRFNDGVTRGSVISQSPSSGTGFKGDRIELVVSRGRHMVQVPSVIRSSAEEATSSLKAAGFKVDVVHNPYYIGADIVVSQDPSGDSMAPYGSTVTVSVI